MPALTRPGERLSPNRPGGRHDTRWEHASAQRRPAAYPLDPDIPMTDDKPLGGSPARADQLRQHWPEQRHDVVFITAGLVPSSDPDQLERGNPNAEVPGRLQRFLVAGHVDHATVRRGEPCMGYPVPLGDAAREGAALGVHDWLAEAPPACLRVAVAWCARAAPAPAPRERPADLLGAVGAQELLDLGGQRPRVAHVPSLYLGSRNEGDFN
jgi:hypothetical protein